MSRFDTLYATENPLHYRWIFRYKEHKFKLVMDHENGAFRPSLYIMKPDGSWQWVADTLDVGGRWENVSSLGEKYNINRAKTENGRVCENFKEYIKAVY